MCSNLIAKLAKDHKFGTENYCNSFDKRWHMQFQPLSKCLKLCPKLISLPSGVLWKEVSQSLSLEMLTKLLLKETVPKHPKKCLFTLIIKLLLLLTLESLMLWCLTWPVTLVTLILVLILLAGLLKKLVRTLELKLHLLLEPSLKKSFSLVELLSLTTCVWKEPLHSTVRRKDTL